MKENFIACNISFGYLGYYRLVTLKAQPSRSLPGKAMFTKKPPAIDPYPGLYHMIKNWLELTAQIVMCVVLLL